MLSMVSSDRSGATTNNTTRSTPTTSTTTTANTTGGDQFPSLSTLTATNTSVARAIAALAGNADTYSEVKKTPRRLAVRPDDYQFATGSSSSSCLNENASGSSKTNGEHSNTPTAPTVVRLTKRSTKSKCSPGLRSGKWTAEEEAFTNLLIHYFKRGLLNVEDGTSLRWYLAKRLNCEAMRVTKKLKGNSSIGKQIFRALENNEENRLAIAQAAEEIAVLEHLFLDSLAATGQPLSGSQLVSINNGSGNSTTTASASSVSTAGTSPTATTTTTRPLNDSSLLVFRPKKSMHSIQRPVPVTQSHSHSRHQPVFRPSVNGFPPQDKPQANSEEANLLLHFFIEAHSGDSEEEGNNGAISDKKRSFSHTITDNNTATTTTTTADQSTAPPSKRQSIKISNLMD